MPERFFNLETQVLIFQKIGLYMGLVILILSQISSLE